jgi:hypothetical protein
MKTISVSLIDGGSAHVIDPIIMGKLAIHPTYGQRKRGIWTLTHIPTGLAFSTRIYTKRNALRMLRKLQSVLDWNFTSANSRKIANISEQGKTLIRHYKDLGYIVEP